MTIDRWLAAAEADARQRNLEDLIPLLRGLAKATRALRTAGWNQRAPVANAEPADEAGEGT